MRLLVTGATGLIGGHAQNVPCDDREARARLRAEPFGPEDSFRDLLAWMHGAGVLEPYHVGRLAESTGGAS